MTGFKFVLEGAGSLKDVFQQLEEQIADKNQQSKILVSAVRESMRPVLTAAKQNAPKDTNGLMKSLIIEARRPTRKDKRSKYVNSSDTVIALVTTASGKKLKRIGVKSDARSIAQEFGTAHNPAQPYLRPALEGNSQRVANDLGQILARRLEKFKAR